MTARDPFYEMVYHREDWTLVDAFRPQPGWGRRRFTVSASIMDQEGTEQDVVAAAGEPDSSPPGYRLTSVTLYSADGSERVIWSTPPDSRFAAPTSPTPAQEGKP